VRAESCCRKERRSPKFAKPAGGTLALTTDASERRTRKRAHAREPRVGSSKSAVRNAELCTGAKKGVFSGPPAAFPRPSSFTAMARELPADPNPQHMVAPRLGGAGCPPRERPC